MTVFALPGSEGELVEVFGKMHEVCDHIILAREGFRLEVIYGVIEKKTKVLFLDELYHMFKGFGLRLFHSDNVS